MTNPIVKIRSKLNTVLRCSFFLVVAENKNLFQNFLDGCDLHDRHNYCGIRRYFGLQRQTLYHCLILASAVIGVCTPRSSLNILFQERYQRTKTKKCKRK